MPLGLNRKGDFRNGNPINLPHEFGNVVAGSSEPYGNVQPQSNTTLDSNPVGTGDVGQFGNQVSFSLEMDSASAPVLIVAPGGTGTINCNLTNLLGANSATLSYFGAPSGVTLAFAPNPDTGTTVVTVTVGASVPAGEYTVTIVGTVVAPNVEYVNLRLVVAGSVVAPSVALVAHIAANSPSGTTLTTSAVNTTGANFLVITGGTGGGTPSDSKGNTWIAVNGPSATLWYAKNATVGSNHTFTLSGSAGTLSIACAAFSGLTTNPFESSAASVVTVGTTVTANAVQANTVGDLIIQTLSTFRLSSPPTSASINDSFIVLDTGGFGSGQYGAALAYLIAPSTSAVTPTWTVSTSGTVLVATAAVFAA